MLFDLFWRGNPFSTIPNYWVNTLVWYWSNCHVKTSQIAQEEKLRVVKFRALNNLGEASLTTLSQIWWNLLTMTNVQWEMEIVAMGPSAIWESVSARTTNILCTKVQGNMVCSLPKQMSQSSEIFLAVNWRILELNNCKENVISAYANSKHIW